MVAPKIYIFLYNAMKTTGVCQGMGIMYSDVMDTVIMGFYAMKLSAEVSAVLRWE